MLHAVYITNGTSLVYQYLDTLGFPGYDALKHQIHQHKSSEPVIHINAKYYVCFHQTVSLTVYVLCSKDTSNPLLPFVFISRLLEVMEDYFGSPVVVSKITANNDTLTLIINDMIDNGLPHVTDFNKLRDLIPFKSLLSKFLQAGNDLTKKAGGGATSQVSSVDAVPWRRANVRYTNNEMYVDIVETINVTLRPARRQAKLDSAFYSASHDSSKLVPIYGTIAGQVDLLSHLTGVPHLQLVLNTRGIPLNLPQFHRCINIDKWFTSNGTLLFIPPDGKATLMLYTIDIDRHLDMLGLVDVDLQSGLGVNANEFSVRLIIKTARLVAKIENLAVKMTVPDASVTFIKSTRASHGDFHYQGGGVAEWNLRTVVTGLLPVLNGVISTLADSAAASVDEKVVDLTPPKKFPMSLSLSYTNRGSVPSGIKVDSLKIISSKGMGDSVKPYKGVKYITNTGQYVVRA